MYYNRIKNNLDHREATELEKLYEQNSLPKSKQIKTFKYFNTYI